MPQSGITIKKLPATHLEAVQNIAAAKQRWFDVISMRHHLIPKRWKISQNYLELIFV